MFWSTIAFLFLNNLPGLVSNWEQSGPLSPGGQAQLQTELDCLRTPPFLHTLVQLAEIIRINYKTQYFNKNRQSF